MTNNTKMIRDAYGDVVPQTLNDDGSYTVLSNGDVSGIDFNKYKLLRDALGDVLPSQYFDVEQGKFVAGSIGGGGSGEKGEKGDDGKSAYEIAREQGFAGTEAQWITSLKGAKGDTGATGPAGSNATVTNASVVSALGFTPANTTTLSAHTSNNSIHITSAEKTDLLRHMNGTSIEVSTSSLSTAYTPARYYAERRGTVWELWKCSSIGILEVTANLTSAVCTIVPEDLASEKIIQVAYTIEGTFIRYSSGNDESTAIWTIWSKLVTSIDLNLINREIASLREDVEILKRSTSGI